jgi:hypothetical protein
VDQQVIDRRVDARFSEPLPGLSRATVRPGCAVAVIDLSAGGALVQAARPLRPGAHVHLQLVTSRRTFSVAAHVLRCAVWSLDADHGVLYRGALQFEHRWEFFRDESASSGHRRPPSAKSADRDAGRALPQKHEGGFLDRVARSK